MRSLNEQIRHYAAVRRPDFHQIKKKKVECNYDVSKSLGDQIRHLAAVRSPDVY